MFAGVEVLTIWLPQTFEIIHNVRLLARPSL
jgi:hypothetical protein